MKIALGSDLHLEMGTFTPTNPDNADVLILAGDILVAQDLHDHPADATVVSALGRRQASARAYREFMAAASQAFPRVIVIAGNHEFYHGRWVQALDILRAEYSQFPNVYFLENDVHEIEGIRFLGATLWTDLRRADPVVVNSVRDAMNDYSVIRHDGNGYRRISPWDTMARHRASLAWLTAELAQHPDQPTVVITHHAPTGQSVSSGYRSDIYINPAYHSDLENLILDNPQIRYWFHGHMHDASDYLVGDTRVVANPRGYVGYERADHALQPYLFQTVEV